MGPNSLASARRARGGHCQDFPVREGLQVRLDVHDDLDRNAGFDQFGGLDARGEAFTDAIQVAEVAGGAEGDVRVLVLLKGGCESIQGSVGKAVGGPFPVWDIVAVGLHKVGDDGESVGRDVVVQDCAQVQAVEGGPVGVAECCDAFPVIGVGWLAVVAVAGCVAADGAEEKGLGFLGGELVEAASHGVGVSGAVAAIQFGG
jgi:hypothetical protein